MAYVAQLLRKPEPDRDAGLRRFEVASRAAAAGVIAIGVIVLVGGWLAGNDTLKQGVGDVSMKANTAACLVLCGLALLLLGSATPRRRTGRAAAAVAGLVGTVTLVEYVTGWNAGIDELVFRDTTHAALTGVPGRMSPQTAVAFVLSAMALLALDWRPRGHWPAGMLAGAVGALAATVLLGHVYDLASLYVIGPFTAMAAHTAVAFLILALGIGCCRPQWGMAALIASDTPAGVMARTLLPPALVVPPIIGTLVMVGQRHGFYGDGEGIWLLILGTVIGCVTFAITASRSLQSLDAGRRNAESRLREQERKYRTLIEQLPLVAYVDALDEHNTPLYVSPQVESVLGYTPGEWLADPAEFERLVHPHDLRRVMSGITHFRDTGEPFRCEYRVRSRDGRWVWLRDETVQVLDPEGKPLYAQGYMLDVTARKAAEEETRALEGQLHQAQKLESIGQLAGGVAHDFNNMLGAIIAYAGFAEEKAVRHPEVLDEIAQIRHAAERGTELTQSLLVFGRRDFVRPQVVDVTESVGEAQTLLRPLLGDRCVLRTTLTKRPVCVEADPSQFQRVLMNLVLNARAAMPRGGTVEVVVSAVALDAASAPAGLAPGSYACLAVSDTGVGMAEQIAERAFDPFFTTKPKGEGTGLGLAIVYSIVKRLAGHVEIDSKLGIGTKVTLLLPMVETEPGTHAGQPMRRPAAGDGQVVLVVDDDPALRHSTARILASHGYAVLEADDGVDALERFREADPRPALLVTDVAMPGMTGIELAERVSALDPDARVVLMSGYAEELEAAGDDLALVAKPFSADVMLSAVAEALSAHPLSVAPAGSDR